MRVFIRELEDGSIEEAPEIYKNILDDVVFIKRGQLVAQSTVDNIRSRFGKTVDAYFREVFAC
jgi:ABC-type multidrug transport system ATPase subunit